MSLTGKCPPKGKRSPHSVEARLVEQPAQPSTSKVPITSDVARLQLELERSRELLHQAATEQEHLREELQRRNDLIEKKDSSYQAQVRKMELADARIRELVHSEGEANYKSRAAAGKLGHMEKTLSDSENVRKALEKKLQNSLLQTNELTKQVHSQANLLEQLRAASDKHSQDSVGLQQYNRDLEGKLARAVGKLELYQNKLQSLQRQISDRETELTLAHQKADMSAQECSVVRQENDEARKQIKTHREHLIELEEELAKQNRHKAEAQEALDLAQRELTKRELQIANQSSELSVLEAKLKDSEQSVERSFQKQAELQDRIDHLEVQLQNETQRLAADIEAKTAELSSQGLDRQHNLTKLETVQKERDSLARDLEERLGQLKELKAFADRMKPAYETLKDHFTELQASYQNQTKKLENSTLELTNASVEREEQHQVYQDLEKRFQEALTQRDELESQKLTLTQKLQEQHDQLKAFELTLEKQSDSSDRLTDELLAERKEVRELHAKLEQLSEELSNEQANAQGHSAIAAKLSSDLTQVRQDHQNQAEQLKLAQIASTKAHGHIKELLRHRSQLLEHKTLLEARLSAGDETQAQARQQFDSLLSEKDTLQVALDELQSEYDRCLSDSEDKIQRLQEKLEQTVSDYDHQIEELVKTSSATLACTTREFEATRQNLTETLTARESELIAFESRYQKDIEEAELRHRELESTLTETQAQHQALITKHEESSKKATQELAHLQAHLESIKDKGQQTQDELETDNEKLKANLKQSQDNSLRLQELSRDLQARMETLESELQARREESEAQIDRRVALEQDLGHRIQEIQELKSQLDRSQRERTALREVIDKLQRVSKERLETAKAALITREGQIQRLREANEHQAQELAQNKLKLGEVEETATQTKAVLAQREAKLERADLAEKALRGALTDLRHMLHTKEDMVGELEWHLGLVYDTLEGVQDELETQKNQSSIDEADHIRILTDLQNSCKELQDKFHIEHLQTLELADQLHRETVRLNEAQTQLVQEHEHSSILGHQLAEAHACRTEAVTQRFELEKEIQAFRDAFSQEVRLGERPHNLSDRQALTHLLSYHVALRDEVERLRQAIDHTPDPSSVRTPESTATAELDRLRDELQHRDLEHARQVQHYEEQLKTLQIKAEMATTPNPPSVESSDEQTEEYRVLLEQEQRQFQAFRNETERRIQHLEATLAATENEKDTLSDELYDLKLRSTHESSSPEQTDTIENNLLRGFELGSDLVSLQLEFLAVEERKSNLLERLDQTDNPEEFERLSEEMLELDSELLDSKTEFETFETQWNAFHNSLDHTSQLLLQRFTGLIEVEMREARRATEETQIFAAKLEQTKKRYIDQLESLERELEDKNLVNGELEEELAQLASQVTELNEELVLGRKLGEEQDPSQAASSRSSLLHEIETLRELLKLYREERSTDPDRSGIDWEIVAETLPERLRRSHQRLQELRQSFQALNPDRAAPTPFSGTLLSNSKLLEDLGLDDFSPAPTLSGDGGGPAHSIPHSVLLSVGKTLSRLESEQASDELAYEKLGIAYNLSGADLQDASALDEKGRLQLNLILNALSAREEAMFSLTRELHESGADAHPTIEDLPTISEEPAPTLKHAEHSQGS